MADISLSNVELSKLKVSDLKKLLKARDLSIAGNKAELIARLEEHELTGITSLDHAEEVDEDLQPLEDDSLLDTDSPPAKVEAPTLKKVDISKKVVIATDDKEMGKFVAEKITMKTNAKTDPVASSAAKDALKKRAERFGAVAAGNVENKKTTRAERFGATNTDSKQLQRAARFGLPVKGPGESAAAPKTVNSDEKLRKRAERFGASSIDNVTSVSSAPSKALTGPGTEKLKQRAQRFGAIVAPTLAKDTEKERILKRKNRFGAVIAGSGSEDTEAKKQKRAERFSATS